MARYYEQWIDGRIVINTTGDPTQGRIADAITAPCWLEAKRRLGWPLTDRDEAQLDQFHAERKARRKK